MAVTASALLPGCASTPGDVPACADTRRVTILAQAVPNAAYLPCVDHLTDGWQAGDFVAERGRAHFDMQPEGAGNRTVRVVFQSTCNAGEAVPTTARADGVRTSIALRSIAPRYAGTLIDVFPGGCVTYRFDFARGPHIALMEELQASVGLLSRQQLRVDLRRRLGAELDG